CVEVQQLRAVLLAGIGNRPNVMVRRIDTNSADRHQVVVALLYEIGGLARRAYLRDFLAVHASHIEQTPGRIDRQTFGEQVVLWPCEREVGCVHGRILSVDLIDQLAKLWISLESREFPCRTGIESFVQG